MLLTVPGLSLRVGYAEGEIGETLVRQFVRAFSVSLPEGWLCCHRTRFSVCLIIIFVGTAFRMGWRKSICKVLQHAERSHSIQLAASPKFCSSVALRSLTERQLACNVPVDAVEKKRWGVRSYIVVDSCGTLPRKVVAHKSGGSNSFGAIGSDLCDWRRTAGIHVGRTLQAVEPTYGVGPRGGPDRDGSTKGSTPDDFRADYIHMAEPKEITKEKAAAAQEEPPDFQVRKMMPDWEQPTNEEADSQRESGDKVFEGKTRKLEGTAQFEGETTGNESGEKVEGQYGAASSEGKTSRS